MYAIRSYYDLGQPQRGWHVLYYWNLHSPMFEVSMCVMAYTTVLFLEFLSPVAEKFGWNIPLRILRWLEMPLVILAASISTFRITSYNVCYTKLLRIKNEVSQLLM